MEMQNLLLKDAGDPRKAADASNGGNYGWQRGRGVDATLKERECQWGEAYKQIAGDWNAVLGTELSNEEFIAMMLLMKVRRWKNSGYSSKDCLTDIIGYAKLGLSLQ